MISLQNDYIRFEMDDNARVTLLEDLKSGNGNIIQDPKPLFRAGILTTAYGEDNGENKEDVAFAGEQAIRTYATPEGGAVEVDTLRTRMGAKAIRLRLSVSLHEDALIFGGMIENGSSSMLNELFYPCLGEIRSLGNGEPDLLMPYCLGLRYNRVGAFLRNRKGRESYQEMAFTYPGYLSMGFMQLTDRLNHLYFATHDPLFHVTSLRAVGSDAGGVTLEMDKLCYVRPGETWDIPIFVVRLYQGSWRSGADTYVQWASTWRRPVQAQDWMKRSNGYFLVINKQQYGDEAWPYRTIPDLYDMAQSYGFDVLGLFGWYHTGHDNNYPDLSASPTMGGEEELKEGIRKVHDRGGHVTLYYQGHLMDVNSPFYRQEGYKWEGRNVWDNPYYETYPKFCYSDALRFFSRKIFSTVCPSVPSWHELMADRIDWIASFGADGALYDQVGGMLPYPCFNPSHPHKNGKPSLSYTQGRLAMHRKIRERVAHHSGFAFMSEHITDTYSQFLDCVHGIGGEYTGRPGAFVDGTSMHCDVPVATMFPHMFRYCFPETLITIRNPSPETGRRLMNYGFTFGLKFELEIRYETDRKDLLSDKNREERLYCLALSGLRRRFEPYLLTGTFRADEGVLSSNVVVSRFDAENGTRVLVIWNDTDKAVRPEVQLQNGTVRRYSTLEGDGSGMPEELAPDSVAVLELD